MQAIPKAPHPTSKRSACDRCRNQKLRCPPRETINDTCSRCKRAGVGCFTSFTKPLGRRAKSTSATAGAAETATSASTTSAPNSVHKPAGTTKSVKKTTTPKARTTTAAAVDVLSTDHLARVLSTPSPVDAMAPHSTTAPTATMSHIPASPSLHHPLPASSWSWMTPDPGPMTPMTAAAAANHNVLSLSLSLPDSTSDMFRTHSFASELSDGLTISESTSGSADGIVDHLFDDYDQFSPFHISPVSDFMDPCGDDLLQPQVDDHQQHAMQVEPEMPNFECDTRISKLGLELSIQLQNSLGKSRQFDGSVDLSMTSPTSMMTDQESPSAVSSSGTTNNNGGSSISSSSNNAFGEALRGMSEFMDIVQSYGPSTQFSTPTGKIGSKPLPSIISTLNLVSVYLQLVLIYDNLFVRLYEQLCSSTNAGSPASFQTLPGLWLAGFSVQQGDLQTKILIQAILHQFETIEKMLGFPQDFRVSGRGATGGGLLDDERSRNLLNAMLSGKCAQVGLESMCGLRALDSLRDNIHRVRQFLDM